MTSATPPLPADAAAPRSAGWFAPLWLAMTLALGVLFFSQGPNSGAARQLMGPTLGTVDHLLTLPLATVAPTDLRAYAILLACAGLLAGRAARRSAAPLQLHRCDALALAIVVAAIASAAWNGTWTLSRGWLVNVAGGALLAILIARIDPRTLARLAGAAAGVAAAALAAAYAHRAALGIRYFRWPIGPIAPTAAFGAIWSAAGAAWLIATLTAPSPAGQPARRPWGRLLVAIALVAAATGSVLICERRGAWLALAGGLIAGVAPLTWRRIGRSGRARWIAVGAAAAALLAGVAFVGWSTTRGPRSGSLSVRYAYWRFIASELPGHWLLGVGPDAFVCRATTGLSRARAEMPHPLHGTLEPSAHNEWLQAAYELGLPGGAAYAALPVAALIATLVALARRAAPAPRGLAALVAAALAALLISEAASVNLRYANLPVWYWVLVGAGLSLGGVARGAGGWRVPRRTGVLQLAAGGLALGLALLLANDLFATLFHARGRAALGRDDRAAAAALRIAVTRLGATESLAARVDLATACAGIVRSRPPGAASQPADDDVAAASAAWDDVYSLCPAYPEVAGRYGDLLYRTGRRDDARRILSHHLATLNPYDAGANLLVAMYDDEPPGQRLEHVCRALRDAAFSSESARVSAAALADAPTAAAWAARVAAAQVDLARGSEPAWRDPLAPEVLRVEAVRRVRAGDLRGASAAQMLAAEAYRRLFDQANPHRRRSEAEAEAWTTAAELRFRADPGDYAAALDAILVAERFAVMGIEFEELRRPDPAGEYVGGQVVPTELPDALRRMWRVSCLLRMAVGRERGLELRAYSALPPDARTPAGMQALAVALARELVVLFGPLPAERRPSHYDRIVELAQSGTAR
ncbi:MAG: O-antigen ligase family protein [Phycisphaerae bacterium]